MSLKHPVGAEWGFWAVTLVDAAICVTLIVADDGQQDAAGRGLQSGLGIVALIVVVALAAVYWSVRTWLAKLPVFVIALLPAMFAMCRAILQD
ncbi:MAG: hypothetical protein ACRYG4_05185 [Janthinobacterium lividum]